MAVTIRDVAREAGVSPATVSRAFNAHPSVGPEYVERVKRAAKKLGYRPNSVARNLRKKTSDVIALIIPDVGNNFHTAIARGVEDVAQEAGLSVLLGNTDENPEKENRYLAVSQMQQVAGVLLCPHDPEIDISQLLDQDVPVVAIDRRIHARVDTVVSSSVEGSYDATRHLADQGWKRIACCTGPADIETAANRAAGYRKAAAELGFTPVVEFSTFDALGGVVAAQKLMDSPTPPDAIFAANEPLALGIIDELRRRGLRPGRDVGMVCFDDSPWAPLIDPPLTVVEQQPYEIGAQAARMLIERLEVDSSIPPRYVEFSTNLIIRKSSLRNGAKG
ncbi:LacI family DNA-binding transcriptional regulator [Scrofimicrobium sp. R131]|uniref:LacI family DNA-binding transcriptional regulator n=1 Tax=Scrofimicrobium appendicitidis TaxID=3079930 RepID=A0AAU7V906_9ACTO